MPDNQADAAAKAAAEKEAKDKADAAAKAAAEPKGKIVCLTRATTIGWMEGAPEMPRGTEFSADDPNVKRALLSVPGLVQPKTLFQKLDAAEKAKAEAAEE